MTTNDNHSASSKIQWCDDGASEHHNKEISSRANMDNDIEKAASSVPPAPPANESTPLIGDSPNNGADALNASISSGSVTSTDSIKDELEKPWPATFERGIQILASPVIDVKKVADYTKSPSVRARYRKVCEKIY